MNEAEKIANRFDWLTTGVRVLMLTLRSKEGGKSNKPDRIAKKYVSTNEDEFVELLDKLIEQWTEGYRIYCTINSRDMEKAIRNFKQMQLDSEYQEQDVRYKFYNDVKNRWISSLMKPNARQDRLFLIDIDDDDRHRLKYQEVLKVLKESEFVEIWDKYRTKNGWHIITEPFNYKEVFPKFEKWDHIKIDALALLKY